MNHHTLRLFAGISALGWIGMFAGGAVELPYLSDLFGVVYHLALIPVLLGLVAPIWAKGAGLFWIMADTALNVASINGLGADDIWALRLGVHIGAALWIFGSSMNMRPFARVVSIALGASLAVHALIAPALPQAVLALVIFPLMAMWLITLATGRGAKAINGQLPRERVEVA
jgi:hypothetical protein